MTNAGETGKYFYREPFIGQELYNNPSISMEAQFEGYQIKEAWELSPEDPARNISEYIKLATEILNKSPEEMIKDVNRKNLIILGLLWHDVINCSAELRTLFEQQFTVSELRSGHHLSPDKADMILHRFEELKVISEPEEETKW